MAVGAAPLSRAMASAFSAVVYPCLPGPDDTTESQITPRRVYSCCMACRGGDVLGAQVEGVLGRLGTGLAALISVSVPLAVAWAALGVWLGRRQERQAEHRPATAPVETPAHAATKVRIGARTNSA